MAVVQISRIQVRRGRANSGTGLPQLASGEIAWAVDTQELYIGNGSVAEGSPAVGNTKIITELDLSVNGNILELLQYIYKFTTPGIQTGPSVNDPTSRSMQSRLDDRIDAADFGTAGDGVTDDTVALQRAIDQLFLNTTTTKASVDTPAGVSNRNTLELPAGIFLVSSTLYVPSYATLSGRGADKTIIMFTGTGSAMQFVNDDSTAGNPSPMSNTLANTQPKHIIVKNMSILCTLGNQTGLQLDAVTESTFDNLTIMGNWNSVYNANSMGIAMNAVSTLVTSSNNMFRDIHIKGFTFGVYAKKDILNNTFKECHITDCYQGFLLGYGANPNVVAEHFGPRGTRIANALFENIKRHAIYIGLGSGNNVQQSKFTNVGNNGGGNLYATYPQVYFDTVGNAVDNLQSDRSTDLEGSTNMVIPYVPEVAGHAAYSTFAAHEITVGQLSGYGLAFRLPVSTDALGNPIGAISYAINYTYRSTANNFSRRGTIRVVADINASQTLFTPVIQLTDEYEFSGTDTNGNSLLLDFRAKLLKQNGAYFTGTSGEVPYSIAIEYTNTLAGDSGIMVFTYTSTF